MSYSKIIDNDFHPVDSGMEATNDHWGTQTQVADVTPGPTGGGGEDSRAVDYALGKSKDPKVLSIGNKTLGNWAKRQR